MQETSLIEESLPAKKHEDDDSAAVGAENIKPLSAKLEDLQTCNELVSKHGAALQRAIGELQELEDDNALLVKVKSVNEKSTLFRITSNAMISACAEFLELAQAQEKLWQKALQHERQQRVNLEETVEALAKQHNTLERACSKNTGVHPEGLAGMGAAADNDSDEEDEDEDEENAEFFDAISETPEDFSLPTSKSRESLHSRTSSDQSFTSEDGSVNSSSSRKDSSKFSEEELLTVSQKGAATISETFPRGTFGISTSASSDRLSKREFRKSIPEKPDYSINLWSILKNCIGRDLSKIPMPVNFNEPLSMLQRLTEELEYSDLLDKAAACESALEQMCYVTAFTVSSYSTTSNRTGKPFNPLLGETFECDRFQDKGWRSLAEQVTHHPPTSALHVEHKDWTFWQEFSCTSKFRGKYLQIIPLGVAHLKFTRSGNHYTWRKVTTTVQNIIVGKLWIDNSGEMDITNHTTNDVCRIKFDAYNYFGRDTPRKVTGVVSDSSKVVRYVVSGTWDNKIEGAKVVYGKLGGKGSHVQKNQPQTLPANILWKRVIPPPGHEKMYSFTDFALTLNDPEDGVALTDSRLRPDQRFMEDCKWDEANQEKQKLEEQQRVRRRKREADAAEAQEKGTVYEGYRPLWFEPVFDDFTNTTIFAYKGGYWEAKEKGDWSMCPNIFLQ